LTGRSPQVDPATGKLKIRRHDADNREAYVVERECLIQNSEVAAEASLPQTVTQHCDRRGAGFVFVVVEDATRRRRYSQRGEHIGGHLRADKSLRLADTSEVVALATSKDADVLERGVLLAPIDEVRISH